MGEPNRIPLPFSEQPFLQLHMNVAEISLLPVEPGGTPRLETSGRWPIEGRLEVHREGEVVVVKLLSTENVWELAAHLKLVAYVPANVRARVSTDFGRVYAERLDQGCDLELSTSAGMVHLQGVVGRMVLRTGAGKISGAQLAGTFDVETAAGAIQLGITGLQAGAHRVRTNMGSVKVDLAPGVKVRIRTRTSMGSARVKYPSADDAPATLELSTDLGAIKVREGDFADDRHGDFPHWDGWAGWDVPKWAAWASTLGAQAQAARAQPRVGDEELRRILSMIEQGTITAEQGEKLIRAIESR